MAGGITEALYCEDLKYPAYADRLLMKSLGVQAGVVGAEDYKVSAGTGLQVNVKAGKSFVEETKAIEESSNTFYNGLYNVLNPTEQNPYNNVEVSAVNPQIAQIILRIYDVNELKSVGSSYGRIEWLNGTPNAGATEAHMKEGKSGEFGMAALPTSSLTLARVLVPKNATKSSEYYIEDARLFAMKWPLVLGYKKENFTPEYGEMIAMEVGGKTVKLPYSKRNAVIGVWALAGETKIETFSGEGIYGDFTSGKTTINLTEFQHVILQGNEGGWLIIAGEPRNENAYGALTERTNEAENEPSATRPTFVTGYAGKSNEQWVLGLYVGGVNITALMGANVVANQVPFAFICPPKVKWKFVRTQGAPPLFSSYLIL